MISVKVHQYHEKSKDNLFRMRDGSINSNLNESLSHLEIFRFIKHNMIRLFLKLTNMSTPIYDINIILLFHKLILLVLDCLTKCLFQFHYVHWMNKKSYEGSIFSQPFSVLFIQCMRFALSIHPLSTIYIKLHSCPVQKYTYIHILLRKRIPFN